MMMDVQMAWQVLAIWAIVVSTIVWFIGDERRLEADRDLARATRYYAHATPFRTRPEPALQPRPRAGAIRYTDRAYFDRVLSGELRR